MPQARMARGENDSVSTSHHLIRSNRTARPASVPRLSEESELVDVHVAEQT